MKNILLLIGFLVFWFVLQKDIIAESAPLFPV